MGRVSPVIYLVVFLLIIPPVFSSALQPDEDEIVLTLWTETDKVPTVEDMAALILSDARWIISSMIYGLEIEYIPSDAKREIDGVFKASLMAEIPFGDSSLRVANTWEKDGRFYVEVRYELADFQRRRTAAWSSNIFPQSEGLGRASFFKGPSARIDSIKDGIKQALHAYLRPLEKNKPREIHSRVIVDDPPYIIIDAGGYISKVRIKISVDRIIPYRIY